MIRLAFVAVIVLALAYQLALTQADAKGRYPPGWDEPCIEHYRALIWTEPEYGAGWLAGKIAANCRTP